MSDDWKVRLSQSNIGWKWNRIQELKKKEKKDNE